MEQPLDETSGQSDAPASDEGALLDVQGGSSDVQATGTRHSSTASSDAWIGKVGIALVIIGAVFLFKLAIDNGWITPLMRVAFGAVLGLALIGFGLRLRPEQQLLRQLLPGGGIAILNVTLFAAVVLYGLLSPPIAWLMLLFVSTFGFWTAHRNSHPLLAWVALVGGTQGVFSLGIAQGMPVMAYGFVNALVALALYVGWKARWPSLAWGAFVFGGSAVALTSGGDTGDVVRLLAMALPVVGSLTVIWRSPVPDDPKNANDGTRYASGLGAANVVMPFTAVIWLGSVLDWDDALNGVGLLAAAIAIGLIGPRITRRAVSVDARDAASLRFVNDLVAGDTFAVPVALHVLVGAVLLFEDEARLFALIGIAFAMLCVAFVNKWRGLNAFGVFTGVIAVSMLLGHLEGHGYATRLFLNIECLLIVATVLAAAGLAWQRRTDASARFYWGVAYAGVLGFVFHQLGGTEGGQALVSVIWSLLGIGLFVFGLRGREAGSGLLHAGRVTLALVVIKLFLIDMEGSSMAAKTIAFLLIGGLFLGVSYLTGRAGRRSDGPGRMA